MAFEDIVKAASEQLGVPKEKEVQKNESWEQTRIKLKSQFWIGMPYEEIIAILGTPTNVNDGSDILAGGTTIASRKTLTMLSQRQYLNWNRSEARYFLTIASGKLVSIYSIDPPISDFYEKSNVQDSSKKTVLDKSANAKKGFINKIKNIFK